MKASEHRQQAETLLDAALEQIKSMPESGLVGQMQCDLLSAQVTLAAAQVHATLSLKEDLYD